MEEPPPPWIVFPSISPDTPLTQGAEEAYVDLDWLPFWLALTAAEKTRYLDSWNASPDWRDAIAMRYDQVDFDVEADAADSAAWAREHRAEAKPASRLPRWLRRGR